MEIGFKQEKGMNLFKLVVFVVFLILLTNPGALAETDTSVISEGEVSAGALASGDSPSISITSDGSSYYSSATAVSSASNGGIATAIASAWGSYANTVYATASAMATAVSSAGQTVYAYAHAEVTVSSEGSVATAVTQVGTSDGGKNGGGNNGGNSNGNGDNGGGGNTGLNIEPELKENRAGFFGYVFGRSFPERYYYFKWVAEHTRLDLDDNNASYTVARARYHMWVIANDDGLNQTQFEIKYRQENYPVNISEMKDRIS